MNKFLTIRQPKLRPAFTLVELLLVIAIVAILASLGVGVMAQAQNDAAVAATRSRISLIEKILEIELENYEVRRSPISFANLATLVGGSRLTNPSDERTLLHIKNLKRMIIADLIRAEMPDGSGGIELVPNVITPPTLGLFPTTSLRGYLNTIGISDTAIDNLFPASERPALVSAWAGWLSNGWTVEDDFTAGDGIDLAAADKAELLYQILQNINFDGIPAIEQLGARAVGDTDADGILEVIDAWGEPLYLQWQQEQLVLPSDPPTNAEINANVWGSAGTFIGLFKEHPDTSVGHNTLGAYCKPVLPTQIRPFLISERLLEIDQLPADYDLDHAF